MRGETLNAALGNSGIERLLRPTIYKGKATTKKLTKQFHKDNREYNICQSMIFAN